MTYPNQTRRDYLLAKIRFLAKCHPTVLEFDYLENLDESALERIYDYCLEVNGQSPDPEARKEANRRRYRAKNADAMGVLTYLSDEAWDEIPDDNLNPEEALLLREEIELRLAAKKKRK